MRKWRVNSGAVCEGIMKKFSACTGCPHIQPRFGWRVYCVSLTNTILFNNYVFLCFFITQSFPIFIFIHTLTHLHRIWLSRSIPRYGFVCVLHILLAIILLLKSFLPIRLDLILCAILYELGNCEIVSRFWKALSRQAYLVAIFRFGIKFWPRNMCHIHMLTYI